MEKENARELIIKSATRLFAEHGLHNVTTRDIASDSGQNISLISYYFGGKENLYKAIIEEFARKAEALVVEVVESFSATAVSRESLRSALLNLIEVFLQMQTSEADAVRILIRERADGLPFSKEIHEKIFSGVGDQLQSIISKGQKAQLVKKKINPDFLIFCLIETLFGNFQMQQCRIDMKNKCYILPKSKNEFRDQLLLIYFEGILL